MARDAQDTRERILDAAERLFASKGFYGVSIREITREAGVELALANYHFGPKQALFEACFLRRAETLNHERRERLAEVRRQCAPAAPSLEAIIDAFVRPLLDHSLLEGEGWKHYFALLAQINNSPDGGGLLMSRSFDPLVREYLDALRQALPQAAEADLYWCYHFLSGALTLTFAETGRIDQLSGGICRSSDLASVHQRLVPYTAAGFRALCDPTAVTTGTIAAESSMSSQENP